MNRRTFIRSSAAGLGGLALLGAGCGGEGGSSPSPAEPGAMTNGHALARIGVQLYTVRSILENDFVGGIEKVAAAGYDEVEFAGYFDHSPADVKGLLDRLGLTAPSAHVGLDALKNDLEAVIEAARVIGHQFVVCPWLAEDQRQTLDDYRGHAAFFNEAGRRFKDAGIQFAYHNHDFEFVPIDGQMPYDLLLAETDADLVKMELDLYWIAYAGQDPLAYFAKHPGRFPLCHVKDMSAERQMVPAGQGTIDFAAVFAQSDEAGLRHYFVEHDNAEDPIQSITASYTYLHTLRF